MLCFLLFFTCAGGEDTFVEVEIFKELHATYKCIKTNSDRLNRNLLVILGPKGLGKTHALRYLANYYDGIYIDLSDLEIIKKNQTEFGKELAMRSFSGKYIRKCHR